MGLGKLIPRPLATVAPPTDRARPNRSVRLQREVGSQLLLEMAAYRSVYGFLPTSRLAQMLRLPGAWRATMMYSFLMGSSPNHGYRALPDGTSRKINPTPTFLEFPAGQGPGRRPAVQVKGAAAIDMLWHGNAIGIPVRSPASPWPFGWVGVAADAVSVAWVDPFDLSAGRIYNIGGKIYSEGDVIHWQMPGEANALRGLGVWETQREALALGEYQLEDASSVAANHGVPTGLLYSDDPDAGEPEMAAMKAGWLEAQRQRTIAALGHNTKFEPIAWSPEAGQIVEARQFTLTEMENTFMLPIGWLGGATQSRTYSNIEQDAVNLLKFSWLAGAIPVWEQTLTQQMPRGQYSKNALDAVLRSDTLTRYQAYQIAGGGKPWITQDDIRVLEDMEPLGGEAAELIPPKPVQASATIDTDEQPALEES